MKTPTRRFPRACSQARIRDFSALTAEALGRQVGASATDIVLLFMTDEAVRDLMKDKFELGAEAAVAGGLVGREASAGTDALMEAEILSYSRSRKLFAAMNLKGVVIRPEGHLAVYDKSARELLDKGEQDPNNTAVDLSSFSKTVSAYTARSETINKRDTFRCFRR